MQHPEEGHVMDEATIRKDFELLKQFNFNAVRTSHYPPVNNYLELAENEYGLYIIDEVGDEAHASEWISSLPEYEEMYRERCRRMVLRDRNHPCVLFWSAGNESGEGINITHTIEEGKIAGPHPLLDVWRKCILPSGRRYYRTPLPYSYGTGNAGRHRRGFPDHRLWMNIYRLQAMPAVPWTIIGKPSTDIPA